VGNVIAILTARLEQSIAAKGDIVGRRKLRDINTAQEAKVPELQLNSPPNMASALVRKGTDARLLGSDPSRQSNVRDTLVTLERYRDHSSDWDLTCQKPML
jgi:hypothetical protein